MTAALPTARTSPIAGFVDALRRHTIRLLTARETELLALLAVETEHGHALRIARNYADSKRSGYVTELEGR